MLRQSIMVRATWDPEAEVFVATSEDVPGLVAEAATSAELSRKLAVLVPELLVPELLEPNADPGITSDGMREIPLYVMLEKVSKFLVHA